MSKIEDLKLQGGDIVKVKDADRNAQYLLMIDRIHGYEISLDDRREPTLGYIRVLGPDSRITPEVVYRDDDEGESITGFGYRSLVNLLGGDDYEHPVVWRAPKRRKVTVKELEKELGCKLEIVADND